MDSLTGRCAADLQEELGPLGLSNPEGGEWETADRYLSGNVRAKACRREAAAQFDPHITETSRRSKSVQPKDLEPGEIEARLGSSWIPPSDVRDFVLELLDVPRAQREDWIRRDHRDLDR